MIEERSNHATVSIGNKMFVIGGYWTTSCEEFNSYSRIFTILRSTIKFPLINEIYFEAFSVVKNILVLRHFQGILKESMIYFYHVKEKKWSNIHYDFLNTSLNQFALSITNNNLIISIWFRKIISRLN